MDQTGSRIESFNLLHNAETCNLLRENGSYLAALVAVTQSTKDMDASLLGYGSGGHLCHLKTSSFGNGCYALHPQDGYSAVYLLHRPSIVLEHQSVQYKEKFPLLFYKVSTTVPGLVKVQMSARTRTIIGNNSKYAARCPLAESVVIRSDEAGLPKFFLSSDKYHSLFHRQNGGIAGVRSVILFKPPVIAIRNSNHRPSDPDDHSAEGDDHHSQWHDLQKDDVHALKVTPGFRCQGWPSEALSWATRFRHWPPQSVVEDILRQGAIVVPSDPDPALVERRSDADLYWKLDFAEAEQVLIQVLTPEQRRTLLFCLSLLQNESRRVLDLLRTTFFWTLEKEISSVWSAQGFAHCAVKVFERFLQFLNQGSVPDFFIEERNLLHAEELDLAALKDALIELQRKPWLLEKDDQSIPPTIRDQVVSSLRRRLLEVARSNAEITALQLYQRLHDASSVTAGLELHDDALEALARLPRETFDDDGDDDDVSDGTRDASHNNAIRSEIPAKAGDDTVACSDDKGGGIPRQGRREGGFQWLIRATRDVVATSASLLYLKKSQTAYFAKEKAAWDKKARECLAGICHRENALFVLLHEALYHFRRGEHGRVCVLLRPVLEAYSVEDVEESDVDWSPGVSPLPVRGTRGTATVATTATATAPPAAAAAAAAANTPQPPTDALADHLQRTSDPGPGSGSVPSEITDPDSGGGAKQGSDRDEREIVRGGGVPAVGISAPASDPGSGSTATAELLRTQVLQKLDGLVFMCSGLSRSVLPKPLAKNMTLTVNQLLGYGGCSVGTFHPYFVAGYLLAHSLLCHRRDLAGVRIVLDRMEPLALRDQRDMNEKRNVTYLNLLADIYLAMGDKEQAVYLLERSLKMMSNPRNPARWTLLSITTERTRNIVLGGVGVMAVSIAAALAVKLLR